MAPDDATREGSGQNGAHDLTQALADEFRAVHGRPLSVGESYAEAVAKQEQTALCLSGGGIRSAAFSLGVVQALAQGGLLQRFDYLSTVSGGGFTGSWLQALIHEKDGDIRSIQTLLSDEHARPVQALREYTNYLTPHTGVLSEDSWAGIVLYVRNVLINWFAFGPIFLLAVLTAILYRTLLWAVGMTEWPSWIALLIGVGALIYGTLRSCLDIPSHRPSGATGVDYLPVRQIATWIVTPMLAWAFLAPLALSAWLTACTKPERWWPVLVLPLLYFIAMMAGYWLASAWKRARILYWRNFPGWLTASAASALLIWIGLHIAWRLEPEQSAEFLAVLGPPWLVFANVLQATVHVALRREARFGDMDREWLARLSAQKLRITALWMVFAFCDLMLQRVAFHTPGTAWPSWAVPIITVVTGPAAAWIGKQAVNGLSKVANDAGENGTAGRLLGWLLPVLGVVFALALITLLGQLVSGGLGLVQNAILPPPILAWQILVLQVVVGLGLFGWIVYAMRQIDVNRFSMHAVYRNRLARAFLGSVRPARNPDPFSGFDPSDNPRLSALVPRCGKQKLFPVINVTLNLTAVTRTAWAERKAASFTMTPLACGAAELSVPGATPGEDTGGCYVSTRLYAGQERETGDDDTESGLTLATAMTISGAAVSPSWGYHSSPVASFLMTLFNVRLGAWLPNPAVVTAAAELRLTRPKNAFGPLLADLLGATSDKTPGIYLSDGGHFDNLGLYEMLRRRCALILVVDAGQDARCDFADLGDAIRKSSIDLQVEVQFTGGSRIRPRGADLEGALTFAVATIIYPKQRPGDPPPPEGKLLYIKPCYLDDIPADVRAYGAMHPEFPHESTIDQWFSESQFESYRHLGQYQMSQLIGLEDAARDLKALFKKADEEQAGPADSFGPDPATTT